MKLLLFLCIFACCRSILNGQNLNEFAGIDQKAGSIPATETYSSTAIAGYIRSNFKTSSEQLRAIYAWVITNIRYDTDSMYYINWSMYPEERIAATLRRRKGVCENYAALFTDIALKCGFQAFIVSGYTRQGGAVNSAGHSWCAVNLQEQWFLCDPTWDKDNGGNTKYYLVSPAQFIESHMPFDPLWQLLEYPLTDQEFRRGYSKRDKPPVNYNDSAGAFLQLDSLQQLEASTARIRQAGIENERVKSWLAYNQMKIAIIYGEKDMNLYNSAVEDLNKANDIFNDFVQFRNKRFIPLRPDSAIKIMLYPIAGLIKSARKKLDLVGLAVENFQYDTGQLKNRLAVLEGRVKEQQDFLKRYLAANGPDRGKLFYKKTGE